MNYYKSVFVYFLLFEETPILTGEDAERFVRDMEEVEARSKEEREASRKEFQERVKEAKKLITFCL